jgi:hypothetical protein
VGAVAVQEQQARLADLAPGQQLDLAPSTGMRERSGATATAASNQAGAGGFSP